MTTTAGVLYLVMGRKHLAEARQSAASLKTCSPHLPTMIVTDEDVPDGLFDVVHHVASGRHSRLDKIGYLSQAPFDEVLFLDSDTYVCSDISPIFEMLKRFDLVLAHAPRRRHREYPPLEGVPSCFCEFNSGVMAFRNSAAVHDVFDRWSELYRGGLESDWFHAIKARKEHEILQDQHFLRKAVFESDIHIGVLPYEYNCRLFPGFVSGEVKILHGRHRNFERAAREINATHGKRFYVPTDANMFTIGVDGGVVAPVFRLLAWIRAIVAPFRRSSRRPAARRSGSGHPPPRPPEPVTLREPVHDA